MKLVAFKNLKRKAVLRQQFTCIRVSEAWKTGLWSGALLLSGLLKPGAWLRRTPEH